MDEIPEVGCENCGSSLIRASTTPLVPGRDPLPMNDCGDCGHHSPFKFSFHWPVNLRDYVQAKWHDVDMKAFRLDPVAFVKDHLNPWLKDNGKGKVVIEGPEKSRHLRWDRG